MLNKFKFIVHIPTVVVGGNVGVVVPMVEKENDNVLSTIIVTCFLAIYIPFYKHIPIHCYRHTSIFISLYMIIRI